MTGTSSRVKSRQLLCHENLGALVAKHLHSEFRRPVAAHTRAAFAEIQAQVEHRDTALIFDSFCGTGMSTALLAAAHPEALVIGIDKSADRLHKHQPAQDSNYLLVQADCGDFWSLALAAGWKLQKHYLLYPNPWPKKGQLKRRVHGSPSFPCLLALGGRLELRSNWQVYVEEFGSALHQAGHKAWVDSPGITTPISLFERKYLHSGHQLWRCRGMLRHNAALTGGS